ncbi:MAG: hypothetical protein LKI24_12715 [Acidipropionibacterium sp.]|jgi:hypothetical protein|nr:hypothetical protein [Acidipropionibacterium sp.]
MEELSNPVTHAAGTSRRTVLRGAAWSVPAVAAAAAVPRAAASNANSITVSVGCKSDSQGFQAVTNNSSSPVTVTLTQTLMVTGSPSATSWEISWVMSDWKEIGLSRGWKYTIGDPGRLIDASSGGKDTLTASRTWAVTIPPKGVVQIYRGKLDTTGASAVTSTLNVTAPNNYRVDNNGAQMVGFSNKCYPPHNPGASSLNTRNRVTK